MTVYLVGAGPGDAELLTVRAASLIAAADVVVHDALVGDGVLALIPDGVEVIDVGKRPGQQVPQEKISRLLVDLADQHRTVVRLKGGDPFVFGRGGEEALALLEAGVAFEVVPGITSSVAAPAAAGIPVTHRGVSAAVTVVTGHRRRGEPDVDWRSLARVGGTIVVLMGVSERATIAAELIAGGLDPATPAAAIRSATTDDESILRCRLDELATAAISPPATIVIGDVAALDLRKSNLPGRPPYGVRPPRRRRRMRAITHKQYGPPDVLELTDVERPTPDDNQALVRVYAASVNALDWHLLRGAPYVSRLQLGLRRPKHQRRGNDAAGVVEAVGPNVTHLRPGDRVFGMRAGSFAEYVSGQCFAPMPPSLTFAEAAALPTAGITALQAVRDHGAVQPGASVLVYGAGGGVGSFAVQIATAFGAEVTAVTRTESIELARELGASHVIDHRRDDFTRRSERYDVIIDNGGNHRVAALRRALAPGGRIVLVAPAPGNWLGVIVRFAGTALSAKLLRRRVRAFLASETVDDLTVLAQLVSEGKLRSVIEATYPLADTAEAIAHLERGGIRGKIVIDVAPDPRDSPS